MKPSDFWFGGFFISTHLKSQDSGSGKYFVSHILQEQHVPLIPQLFVSHGFTTPRRICGRKSFSVAWCETIVYRGSGKSSLLFMRYKMKTGSPGNSSVVYAIQMLFPSEQKKNKLKKYMRNVIVY